MSILPHAPEDFPALTEALRASSDDYLRTTFAKNLTRLIEVERKVIQYDREVLPLEEQLGCRVQVSGGYSAAYQPGVVLRACQFLGTQMREIT